MSTRYLGVVEDPIWPLEIQNGQVGVILENHRVLRELRPGIHRRRPTGLKWRTRKQLITISTFSRPEVVSGIPVTVTTAEEPAVVYAAAVNVTVVLRTNPDSGLLAQAVQDEDPENIDASIARLTRQAVADQVAHRLSGVDHDVLMGQEARLTSLLDPGEIQILDGLLRGVRFEGIEAIPNDHLRARYEARVQASLELHRAQHEESVLDLRSQSQAQRAITERDSELRGIAATSSATGIPFQYVQDPERYDRELDRQQRLIEKMLDNPESLKHLSRDPEVLKTMLSGPTSSMKGPQPPERSLAEAPDLTLRLGRDENLGMIVARTPILNPASILGSAMVMFTSRDGLGCEAILVPKDAPETLVALPDLQRQMQLALRLSTALVHVVPYHATVPAFVQAFYLTTAPAQHYGYRGLSVVVETHGPEFAKIIVRVDGARRSLTELLLGEDNRRHEQLKRLLDVQDLEVDSG